MNNEDYLNDTLSRHSIDELVAIWYESTLTKSGVKVQERINEQLPVIAQRYGLKNWTDFRTLVQEYDEKMYRQGCSGTPETCLMHYTILEDVRNVKIAIRKGATNLNVAMGKAAELGNMTLVRLFINHGARDWKRGLYGAAKGGYEYIVEYFLNKGADNYDAAYRIAQVEGHWNIMKLIEETTPFEYRRDPKG